MRRYLFLLWCLCSITVAAQELTVGSYNIRYKNRGDSIKGNGWQDRCPSICHQLLWERPDIFGAQEVLHAQLLDLERGLKTYRWIGEIGRASCRERV